MILDTITELSVVEVRGRAVPNQECICIQANVPVTLGAYAISIGLSLPNGGFVPMNDSFFWLGQMTLAPRDWLFIFTGPGAPKSSIVQESNSTLYMTYWGRKQTMFNQESIIPMLLRMDASAFAPRPGIALPPPVGQTHGGGLLDANKMLW